MSDSKQREEAVFEAALQLQGAERAAYLDQACAGDPALRERIEGLLGALERAGGRLSEPAVPRDTATEIPSPTPTEKMGDRIQERKIAI
jgi:eukaryotic-like serine/threonine-protein kinase